MITETNNKKANETMNTSHKDKVSKKQRVLYTWRYKKIFYKNMLTIICKVAII